MQCHTCGTALSSEASTCLRCSALISSSDPHYDVIPYIETQTYMEQETPSTSAVLSTNIQKTELSPDVDKSVAAYLEQRASRNQSIPGWMMALLILLSLVLILEGIGSAIYAVNVRPADMRAQATATTQNFLTAQTQRVAQARAYITTAMTPEQVYQQATSSTPIIDDPLHDDSGNVWLNYSASSAKPCSFQDGSYHAHELRNGSEICTGYGTEFHNLAFQAQIKIIKGEAGGLIFRKGTTGSYYLCFMSTTGDYSFYVVNSLKVQRYVTGTSPAIVTGLNQVNQITIIAFNSHIYLYINSQFIQVFTDTTYNSGQIALIGTNQMGPIDVAFNNVKVWKL